jgi:hypothetical protein
MKNKDQILLENLYDNIINEFTNEEHKKLEEVLRVYGNRRIVFTDRDEIQIGKTYEQQSENELRRKPTGLWYALGGAWNEFLNSWNNHGYEYKNVFYIDIDYTDIIRINTSDKFKKFAEEYFDSSMDYINWNKVSKKYKGIEIIPMRWDMRHKFFWYNGWDLPSGCIWNTSCIKNYKNI